MRRGGLEWGPGGGPEHLGQQRLRAGAGGQWGQTGHPPGHRGHLCSRGCVGAGEACRGQGTVAEGGAEGRAKALGSCLHLVALVSFNEWLCCADVSRRETNVFQQHLIF